MPDELEMNLAHLQKDARRTDNRATRKIQRNKAKAQLNALFLSQALDLIGADDSYKPSIMGRRVSRKTARNELRAELRTAFQAKYGGK